LIANETAHRVKCVPRTLYAKLIAGLIAGFGSASLALILRSKLDAGFYITPIIVGLAYGAFMVSGKAFESLK